MNKILIGAGAVVIVGLIALGFWLTAPAGQPAATNLPNTSQNTGLPVAGTVTQSASADQQTTMSFAAVGGGTIQASNFINDPVTVEDPNNQGYYYLGYHMSGATGTTATGTPPYLIEYINATQYFNIALLQEPIGPVREDMQQYLMVHLGITQNQMCKLNYMVSVPDRVNSNFSGKNLGFSFCPGATVLPK